MVIPAWMTQASLRPHDFSYHWIGILNPEPLQVPMDSQVDPKEEEEAAKKTVVQTPARDYLERQGGQSKYPYHSHKPVTPGIPNIHLPTSPGPPSNDLGTILQGCRRDDVGAYLIKMIQSRRTN